MRGFVTSMWSWRRLARTGPLICIAAAAGALGASQSHAQSKPPEPHMGLRMDDAVSGLTMNPRLRYLSKSRRRALVEFVTGNTLFVLVHELGHTAISEMGLPVLGKEEDAADSFATILALKVGTSFSHRILMEAAKGWFLSAKRDDGKLDFYDEHGLDKQRAYNVVCLMVGSDPEKFKPLADETKLPEERQQSCVGDFSNASWSWDQVLKPHRRSATQPKTKIDVIYGEGSDKFPAYAKAARSMRLLETVAEYASEEFVWRQPFALEMRACGDSNARWDLQERKIILCYEIAAEFAELYFQYGASLPNAESTMMDDQ
jgi:hypothetical protein